MENVRIIECFFHVTHMLKRKRKIDDAKQDGPAVQQLQPRERDRVLRILNDHPEGLSQRSIAGELHIRPQSASELLDKLESEDLIRREKNPADKRMVLVFATQRGKERYQMIGEQRRSYADQLLEPLSDEEQEELYRLMRKILTNAEQSRFGEEES